MSHTQLNADGSMTVVLPLPPRALSPNARRGQSIGAALRKSRCVKAHRLLAKATVNSGLQQFYPNGVTFAGYKLAHYFRTAAFRDDDNADGACKAYRDGIADAIMMDDKHLRKLALSTIGKDAKNPRVEITLIVEGGKA